MAYIRQGYERIHSMAIKTNALQVRRTILQVKTRYIRAKPVLVNRSAEVIKQEIGAHLDRRQSITGGRLEPLAGPTVRAKRRKGSATPRHPLIDKGIMRNVVITKQATASDPTARIEPPKSRDKIADIHQRGLGDNPEREWFGVSRNADRRAGVLAQQIIEPIFRNP